MFGRVIGGKYRGKKLALPSSKGIRPTTDRVKESIFNVLQHSCVDSLKDGIVLDLFAGSGSLGIESISRGAAKVVFVDKDNEAVSICKSNTLSLTKKIDNINIKGFQGYCLDDKVEVYFIKSQLNRLNISEIGLKFSLVFLDPPYDANLLEKSLSLLLGGNLCKKGCIFVVESSKNMEFDFLELKYFKILSKTIIKIYSLK